MKSIDVGLTFIAPESIRLFYRNGHQLGVEFIKEERVVQPVHVTLMFPLTDRRSFVQLRDAQQQELGILVDLTSLDQTSRQVLEMELEMSYFIPAITAIVSIEGKFTTDVWTVVTEKGKRSFEVIGKRHSIQFITPDQLIIRDIDGNRYEIPSLVSLDRASRKILEREL